MIPSSDSRVSGRRVQEPNRRLFALDVFHWSSCCSKHDSVCTLPELPTSHFLHAHTVFRHIKPVVKATVSQLPGMIYITMVTLACSPLELLPSDELELRSICITFMASVSQLPLGMLFWVEAFSHLPDVHQYRSLFLYLNPSHPFSLGPEYDPCGVFQQTSKRASFHILLYFLCKLTEFPLHILWGPTKANRFMLFIKYLQDLRYFQCSKLWI